MGIATQDEHVGLIRVDHGFSEKLSSYFRFSKNSTESFAPNAALLVGTRNLDSPQSAVLDFLYLISPRTTNELRIAANYAELDFTVRRPDCRFGSKSFDAASRFTAHRVWDYGIRD